MKQSFLLGAALISSACPAQVPSSSDRLMDVIEQKVLLPEGALPLQRYARHYAFEDDGKVIGVYVLRSSSPPRQAPDGACVEVGFNGLDIASKSAPCGAVPEVQDAVPAGARRWFNDPSELPVIMDGGCDIVTVRFDPSNQRVEQAFCNFEA